MKVNCLPEQETVAVTTHESAISRLVNVDLGIFNDEDEFGDAEKDLVGDTFNALYQGNPEVLQDVPASRSVNKAVMKWMFDSAEFPQARTSTTGSIAAAAIATPVIWTGLMQEETIKEAMEKQRKAEDLESTAKQLEEEASEKAMNGDIDGFDKDMKMAKEIRRQAEREVASTVDKLKQVSQTALGKGMMLDAITGGSEKARHVKSFMRGWGMSEGDLSTEDISTVIESLHTLGAFGRNMSELIGRLREIATNTIASEKSQYTGIISEPDLTRDPLRLFPIEQAYLSSSFPAVVRADKISQLFDGSGLVGWKPKDAGKKGGSFVAAVDRSGSMGARESGQQAKALALAIARALLEDNDMEQKAYSLFLFESSNYFPRVTSDDNWSRHMEWASFRVKGGTDFDNAVRKSILELKRLKSEKDISNADLLFVTDGIARFSEETKKDWFEFKEETGVRMIAIVIQGMSEQLEGLSDLTINVDREDLQDERTIAKLCEKIVKQIVSSSLS